MIQYLPNRSGISPKTSKHESQNSNHSNLSSSSTESNDEHIKEILDSAEKWITQQLLFHEYVTAFDLLEQFDVDPKLARMLITRFEKRTSTYAIYPLSMDSTIPRSSLQPLEQMLESNDNNINNNNNNTNNNLDITYDIHHTIGSSESSNDFLNDQLIKHEEDNKATLTTTTTTTTSYLNDPSSSLDLPILSPSVSPRIYTNPFDYIDYKKSSFDTWFNREKHKYIISIQECAASYNIGLPEFIAEIIVINTVLLPGCYTLTGLLFPAARNESDLFAEYANKENGYITNKTEKGIAYKRKKPMINVRRPENNTASLWLDEDGSICGFRCIWVHGIRGKLMVDQKFCVLNGCWSLTGEITITFEQWDVEDEFEGILETETFCGRWTAGKELYGEFQWFITTIESFYLNHNISIQHHQQQQQELQGNNKQQKTKPDDITPTTRLDSFHDSMGISMEDEFDLEDDINPLNLSQNFIKIDPINILYNKIFDIEINESLTITAKFLKENNVLEISEKQDITDIGNIISSTSTDSFDEDNDEIIGYGQWYRNGKMSFKNVKYIDQKLLLSFDGCCDGKKVLGRLCIYHDNTPNIQQTKKIKSKSIHNNNNNNNNDDNQDKNDLDDDDYNDDEFFKNHTINHHLDDDDDDDDDDDNSDDDDDDDDDDDERISFIQMIIVSNIIPA